MSLPLFFLAGLITRHSDTPSNSARIHSEQLAQPIHYEELVTS